MTSAVPLTALKTAPAWLVHASWQAAVLGLLVLLVTWTLRGRLEARWGFGLWLVVLARLALPVTPPAPWSLFRFVPWSFATSETSSPIAGPVATTAPESHTRVTVNGGIEGNSVAMGEPAAEVQLAWVAPSEPSREESHAPVATSGQWLALTWLGGVLVLLARHGWLHVRLCRMRRTWREASELSVRHVFRSCQEELGIVRPVRLLIATHRYGPATSGVFRASILLPERLLPSLPPNELRLVLLHELTHVLRRDVVVDRVAALLVAVHWFNPVAWLALVCMRRERERACDAAVLRHLGGHESSRYGHALLKVAEQLSTPVPLPGAVGVLGKDRSLVRRIHMIANYRKPTAASKALGVLLFLLLAAFGLTDAGAQLDGQAGTEQAIPAVKGVDAQALPITGLCQDEEGKPLPGAQVVLYREDYSALRAERLRAQVTDDDGRFHFRELPPPATELNRPTWGYALVMTKQGRGSVICSLFAASLQEPLQCQLRPAATLQGRVTDPNGKPVTGALVWGKELATGPVEGVSSTRTDADGYYAITDMAAWPTDALDPKPSGGKTGTVLVGCYFDVLHPDYGHKRPMYRSTPATVDVVLQPAGVIEGKVVDQVAGKPAAGVLVCMQGPNSSGEAERLRQTRTDTSGKYRFPSILAGKYNLWADAPDRACAAIDSFVVEAGKTQEAPDLSLGEGGWIEGRLIDAETGKPISDAAKDGRLHIGLYGPSRPNSGAACQSNPIDEEGRFRLHVAPGINYPYIMRSDYWERTQRREYYQKGIEVKSGELVSLVFRILPTKPHSNPEPAPVQLQAPVPAERQVAAKIRQLGGWYKVDADKHVVEVNMVYHETPEGQRHNNDRTDTDEALRVVSAFPRLKRLFLKGGQATDDGLQSLAKLTDLEVLSVWDAIRITDKGVGHLAGLTNLKEIHFSGGQLGDDSLAVFGRMPGLRKLSLQRNSFSDDGLKHLAKLKELRSLHLGMSRRPITNTGARHLAGLTALEHLDLQKAQLTDEAVAALKNLKQLRSLDLNGPAITDASVEYLLGMPKLQNLNLSNTGLTERAVERLLTLPDLKTLILPSAAISPERRKELQQRRPGLQFIFSLP